MELNDDYFMKFALKEAERAAVQNEIPVGAIVVVEDKIIARAHNLTQRLNDVTAHAEMQAITSAANYLNGKYLVGCTLYVTLEPCVMCAGALIWSQLNRLVYGASDPIKGFSQSGVQFHPKTAVTSGVLKNESKNLLDNFFSSRRKK